jgi:hypothetical protein
VIGQPAVIAIRDLGAVVERDDSTGESFAPLDATFTRCFRTPGSLSGSGSRPDARRMSFARRSMSSAARIGN